MTFQMNSPISVFRCLSWLKWVLKLCLKVWGNLSCNSRGTGIFLSWAHVLWEIQEWPFLWNRYFSSFSFSRSSAVSTFGWNWLWSSTTWDLCRHRVQWDATAKSQMTCRRQLMMGQCLFSEMQQRRVRWHVDVSWWWVSVCSWSCILHRNKFFVHNQHIAGGVECKTARKRRDQYMG